MNKRKTLNKIRLRRKTRIKAKIFGTSERPRFSIFRSNRYTYIQLINDEEKKTIISASDKELTTNDKRQTTKLKLAENLGELIAKKAIEKNIKKVVFDRSWYKYHGRIKAVAEGARKGGLEL